MEKEAFYENARVDLTGPLSGVKVIEATTTWAGPMVGCILADLGAEVLKVEHPKGEQKPIGTSVLGTGGQARTGGHKPP